jgi:hypothetical protein
MAWYRSNLIRCLSNHWLQLGVVVLIAAVLRFVNLSSLPQGIFHDEAGQVRRR